MTYKDILDKCKEYPFSCITIRDFYNILKSYHDDEMPFKIYDVYSWRGIYDQVAFSVELSSSTKKENLEFVEKALTWDFYGYKGGEYEYWMSTPIHFDTDYGNCDNMYLSQFIEDNKDNEFIKYLLKWYEDEKYLDLDVYEDIIGHDIRLSSKVAYYDQEMQRLSIGWIVSLDKESHTVGISDDKFSTKVRNNVAFDRIIQLERADGAYNILSL